MGEKTTLRTLSQEIRRRRKSRKLPHRREIAAVGSGTATQSNLAVGPPAIKTLAWSGSPVTVESKLFISEPSSMRNCDVNVFAVSRVKLSRNHVPVLLMPMFTEASEEPVLEWPAKTM